MQPLPQRVLVAAAVVDAVSRAAVEAATVETGGLLLGYHRHDGDVVVVDATGPGPKAIHGKFSLRPDGPWQRARLAEIYHATSGRVTYLGDWHTHPAGLPIPSQRDVATAAKIAAAPKARAPHPVTLILGASLDELILASYVFVERRLRALPTSALTDEHLAPSLPGLPHLTMPSIETDLRAQMTRARTARDSPVERAPRDKSVPQNEDWRLV